MGWHVTPKTKHINGGLENLGYAVVGFGLGGGMVCDTRNQAHVIMEFVLYWFINISVNQSGL